MNSNFCGKCGATNAGQHNFCLQCGAPLQTPPPPAPPASYQQPARPFQQPPTSYQPPPASYQQPPSPFQQPAPPFQPNAAPRPPAFQAPPDAPMPLSQTVETQKRGFGGKITGLLGGLAVVGYFLLKGGFIFLRLGRLGGIGLVVVAVLILGAWGLVTIIRRAAA